MLHTLAARVVLMVMDNGISIQEATTWVLRKMPKGLREYYETCVAYEAALELYDDAILLTEEV